MYTIFLKWRIVRHMNKWYKNPLFAAISIERSENRKEARRENRDYKFEMQKSGITKEDFLLTEIAWKKFRMPISLRCKKIRKIFNSDEKFLRKTWRKGLEELFDECAESKYFISENKENRPSRFKISGKGRDFMSLSGLAQELGKQRGFVFAILFGSGGVSIIWLFHYIWNFVLHTTN